MFAILGLGTPSVPQVHQFWVEPTEFVEPIFKSEHTTPSNKIHWNVVCWVILGSVSWPEGEIKNSQMDNKSAQVTFYKSNIMNCH